jgi:ADP-ribose pyrophosphatase
MDKKIEIIEKQLGYDGFFRLERYRLRHSLHAGGMSGEIVREMVEKGDVVAVLPYDPVRDEVVLIEQFRIGAIREPSAWLLEIVAGLIEEGETPEAVARRETHEEAGCRLGRLEKICEFLTSPGKTTEKTLLYCGRVDSSGAGGIHGLPHEGEDIRVLPLPFAQALEYLHEGRLNSAWPIIAMQWLALNRERLRADWRSP